MVNKIDNRINYSKFEMQLNMKNIKIKKNISDVITMYIGRQQNKDDTARAQLQHKKTKNNNNNY